MTYSSDKGILIAIVNAVHQTVQIGSWYLAIPLPWWEIFCDNGWIKDDYNINWDELCMWKNEHVCQNDDGDLVLCLRPSGHRGECGAPGATPDLLGTS